MRETRGTDLGAQLYSLESSGNENLSSLIESLFSEESEFVLYHVIFNILHNLLGISPRLYIGFHYCPRKSINNSLKRPSALRF